VQQEALASHVSIVMSQRIIMTNLEPEDRIVEDDCPSQYSGF
jgi:hypothetical protein